jgi:transcriptional regulator with XRE-family HTH domain
MATEQAVNLNLAQQLLEDEEFRNLFFRAYTRNEIAAQLITLRGKRNLRQADLAKLAKTGQSAISRIEQADYESWNYKTLLRVAEVLKARLTVRFDPIEDVVRQYQEKENWAGEESTATLSRNISQGATSPIYIDESGVSKTVYPSQGYDDTSIDLFPRLVMGQNTNTRQPLLLEGRT